ncbi:hypothetical protein [Corynebacterium aquatimens]|uniref:Uncharacterized protein n=1 Tax=Corynebacterium aquatimens TaxID=1190508 RepID=A0A931DV75_9CORY|nr:hypothetical protein [Corynebacterium aquatimens]MBG6122124.1 hypothetical protein [Corynebacterium aquatimens]WJY65335.1 hypothetical protein CAQUA_03090 [Corynebacterium aquatimens]
MRVSRRSIAAASLAAMLTLTSATAVHAEEAPAGEQNPPSSFKFEKGNSSEQVGSSRVEEECELDENGNKIEPCKETVREFYPFKNSSELFAPFEDPSSFADEKFKQSSNGKYPDGAPEWFWPLVITGAVLGVIGSFLAALVPSGLLRVWLVK